MFWHKNKKTDTPEEEKEVSKPKRHPIRKFFKYFFILIFLCLVGLGGAIIWITQSSGGQAWLLATVNKVLAPTTPDEPGMHFHISRISGSLPFNFEIALEASDAHGNWLSAPNNRFQLNWRELPGVIHIARLSLSDIDISRLPEIPPSPEPEPPSKPLAIGDIQNILNEISDFLAQKHWWLPEVKIDNAAIERCLLPPGMIDKSGTDRLVLDADAALEFIDNRTAINLNMEAADSEGKKIALPEFNFNGAKIAVNLNGGHRDDGIDLQGKIQADIDTPLLNVAGLPSDFLGQQITLAMDLQTIASTTSDNQGIRINLAGPRLSAGHASMDGNADWKTGKGWQQGEIDGPYALNLDFALQPPEKTEASDPLGILAAPATLTLNAAGDLPETNLHLVLNGKKLALDGHILENLKLELLADKIELPINKHALAVLEDENNIDLKLLADFDKQPVNLATRLFFQPLGGVGEKTVQNSLPDTWRAGLKDFRVAALGISGSGNIEANISKGAKPAVNGAIKVSLTDWKGIEMFVPNQKFAGDVSLDVQLDTSAATTHDGNLPQNVAINLDLRNLTIQSSPESRIILKTANANIKAADIYKNPDFDCKATADGLSAAGMNLGAKVSAGGPLAGPIVAEVETNGSVISRIAAQWQPGQAVLKTLEVSMPGLVKNVKNANIGIRSNGQAEIAYGDSGVNVRNLDINVLPSGRLRASGGFSPDKLDFKLDLDNLLFKPWQSIVPQIPSGSATLRANLKGTPKRPAGDFLFSLENVSIPANPLPPVSLALTGNIENRGADSALRASLKIDPKSLKALGGDTADVNISVPLEFAENGIPNLNMRGQLGAHVLWDGALGPIWNLLPVADQRLNGRVAINLDAKGSPEVPKISGSVNLNKARYENIALGVLITDINVKLALAEDGALKNLKDPQGALSLPGGMSLQATASDGRGGSVNVQGKGSLNGENLDIKAKVNHLKPLRRRDVHIELSADASVTGSALAPVVAGEVIVNQGEVLLDNLAFAGSVTTLPITTPEDLAKMKKEKLQPPAQSLPAAQPAGKGSLNVRINMLPRFTVEGRGLTSTWQANMLVTGTPENPQITGGINSVSGNFDFLGKIFNLTKGEVTFAGGALTDPLLNIELTNETPDLTAHILVTGPVSKIQFAVTSDPSMPRDEVISHVLFGRSVNDLSRLEALQLAAAVAQLAGFGSGAEGILGMAKKTLGVDVLRVGTSSTGAAGEPGDQTAGGTTIEMGKYINDMIYMGVQQGMKPDSTAFIIQMELTPRTSLEVRTENNNTWGGLKWKYNY